MPGLRADQQIRRRLPRPFLPRRGVRREPRDLPHRPGDHPPAHVRRCQDPCRTTTGRRRQGQRHLRADRRHRCASGDGRPTQQRDGRPAGRGSARRLRHHHQPQHRALRPAPGLGGLGPVNRHVRPGHLRLRTEGIRGGGRHHRHRARRRPVRRRDRAEGPRRQARRRLPALPRPGPDSLIFCGCTQLPHQREPRLYPRLSSVQYGSKRAMRPIVGYSCFL